MIDNWFVLGLTMVIYETEEKCIIDSDDTDYADKA